MKILYIFPEPLPLPGKARALQVMKTILALCEAGCAVDLAYVPVTGKNPFAHYNLQQPKNLTLVPLSRGLPSFLNFIPLKSGLLFNLRLKQWIRSYTKDNRPNALYIRHLKLAARLIQSRLPLPIIYEAHELFADTAPHHKQAHLAQLERQVLHHAADVITITERLGALLKDRYELNRSFAVVPSATDIPLSLPQKNWAQAHRLIIYTGNLYGWKGVDDLIAAAEFLPGGYKIMIVGGSKKAISNLQAKCPKQGAEIVFLGHRSHQEIQSLLAEACIAVLPNRSGSVSEFTSPLKLFEYMANGCAIVASDLPVLHEILDNTNTKWFPDGDPKRLAAKLIECVENVGQTQEMGESNYRKSIQFSWANRAKLILERLKTIREHQA